MLNTYKAILKGNHLEWSEDVPDNLANDQAVTVYVTILDEAVADQVAVTPGQRMAEMLEQLAAVHALADLTDPVAWEREVRQAQ
ncbi:MAG: hypothetical protein HYR94_01820 [Chloroflexi bacterium]|nr:hypothetical protein [Chloroflexota bacterium]